MSDWINHLVSQINIVGFSFSLFVVFIMFTMWRWQKDPDVQFDIRDAFMKNGHVSRDALFEWMGATAFTFIVINQEFKNVVSDTVMGLYAAAMLAKGVTNIIKGTSVTKEAEK